MKSDLWLEQVWLIECSRCANEHASGATTKDLAISECEALGWTNEDGRQFCPQCNNVPLRRQGARA